MLSVRHRETFEDWGSFFSMRTKNFGRSNIPCSVILSDGSRLAYNSYGFTWRLSSPRIAVTYEPMIILGVNFIVPFSVFELRLMANIDVALLRIA